VWKAKVNDIGFDPPFYPHIAWSELEHALRRCMFFTYALILLKLVYI